MDELIRSHAPKRERDFDAAPPAKQRATTNDLSLDRTLDELFAEGGALAGQLRPRKEEDARRLAQRAKQVEFGKNTNGYENYVRAVPKRERKGYQEHPRTPDITQEASKRKFDGIVQAWRRKLHEWDEPAPTAPSQWRKTSRMRIRSTSSILRSPWLGRGVRGGEGTGHLPQPLVIMRSR